MLQGEVQKKHKKLAQSIALKYDKVATLLGITEAQLIETALDGAKIGAKKFRDSSSYKLETYLSWWMRRAIHITIVERVLEIAGEDSNRAREVLLELLE